MFLKRNLFLRMAICKSQNEESQNEMNGDIGGGGGIRASNRGKNEGNARNQDGNAVNEDQIERNDRNAGNGDWNQGYHQGE